MKRFFPGAALLLTLVLTACSPSHVEASRAAELPYTEGQLYAAAWLGWRTPGISPGMPTSARRLRRPRCCVSRTGNTG